MTPLQRYQADLAAGKIYPDPEQQRIVTHLQRVHDDLLRQQSYLWPRIREKLFNKQPKPVKGLYVWGSVGVGKTYLMDLFYQSLPIKRKLRLHFHPFMAEVHQLLTRLQGQKSPLEIVARFFASQARVLCFDEFFVSDIGDAMILGHLLTALFKRGVCLVATSNVPPNELYKNGLQRQAFLPTIALLQQYTQVEQVVIQQDYRLRHLTQAGIYFDSLDTQTEEKLSNWFNLYANSPKEVTTEPLHILGRSITVVKRARVIVWFDFHAICNIPRSQQDYLEIAKQYHIIILSNVPQLKEQDTNAATYLINLVDICYDWHVKLIIAAAAPLELLYTRGRLTFEFQRTCSRLQEMQSEKYLNLPPKKFYKK